MFFCEISIIIILICQKLGLIGPVQQKIKLPSPNYLKLHWKSNFQNSTECTISKYPIPQT